MMDRLFEKITSKEAAIAVVGLGYVGLPLACAFGRHFRVIGLDISADRISDLNAGIDHTGELKDTDILNVDVVFSATPAVLREARIIIVTVPTPINYQNQPDLGPLKSASHMIGHHLQPGSIVVYESTVYPGVTEEICVPILEAESGLTFGVDFTVGYSPERLSPGDSERTLARIVKVVAGSDAPTRTLLAQLYGAVVPAGIYEASSIMVAEAAKVIENTQRDLNVALMNELAIIFHKIGINTLEVIEAASTKWNFIKMTPGLVGGHCIGVDPYYLTYKAQELGYHPEVILAGRRINDAMGQYVAQQTIKLLIKSGQLIKGARILVMGITFKENVSDIRNSKVVDIIRELQDFEAEVIVVDPLAHSSETQAEYHIPLHTIDQVSSVDAIVFAVPHVRFKDAEYTREFDRLLGNGCGVVVDVKGTFGEVVTGRELVYWVL